MTASGRLGRRQLLRAGLVAPALWCLDACGSDAGTGDAATGTTLLCWPGGLSRAVIADATRRFADETTLTYTEKSGVYRDHLTAALSGPTGAPSIVGIKGEDIAYFLPRADLFTDLRALGADRLSSAYLPWKWRQGTTIDGRPVGIPIDIGPTAMFYRADLFGRAGLPTDPAAVDAAAGTWARFRALGRTLRRRLPDVYWIANTMTAFTVAIAQSGTRFVDERNRFVGDGAHAQAAWDLAIGAVADGLCLHVDNDDPAWKGAVADGSLAVSLGAAWHAQDLEGAAPLTAGRWRVAAGPAAGASIGGSFLGIPAAAADPGTAFRIIEWVLSPANQARAFTDARLFPSTPAAYTMPALSVPDPFFGGQRTAEVFSASARTTSRSYEAPSDADLQEVYLDELRNVEYRGKAPAAAWRDALTEARRLAEANGVD